MPLSIAENHGRKGHFLWVSYELLVSLDDVINISSK